MRNLILLSLLFSSVCFAGNFVKKSDIDAKLADCSYPLTVYTKNNNNRVSLPENFKCETFSEQDIMVDDKTKPNWGTRSKIGSCEGESDCKSKALLLECLDNRISYYNEEYSEVWCNKIIDYQKKKSGEKHFSIDPNKKALYEAELLTLKTARNDTQNALKAIKNKLKNDMVLTDSEVRKVIKYLIRNIK